MLQEKRISNERKCTLERLGHQQTFAIDSLEDVVFTHEKVSSHADCSSALKKTVFSKLTV